MMEDEKTKEEKENKAAESAEEKKEQPPLLDEPIKIVDYVYLTILSFEGKAWAFLDMIAHPETQKHKKDIAEAKLAIDVMDALYKIFENNFSPEQKKDLQTRLTNLRLNFAK